VNAKKAEKIKAGDVCRCSIGKLGMVTREGRQRVAYEDGNDGEAYVGICLTDGKPWSSRTPERICTIYELKDFIAEALAEKYLRDMQFGPEDCPEDAARYAFKFASRA
jgi:hypothetical protein